MSSRRCSICRTATLDSRNTTGVCAPCYRKLPLDQKLELKRGGERPAPLVAWANKP